MLAELLARPILLCSAAVASDAEMEARCRRWVSCRGYFKMKVFEIETNSEAIMELRQIYKLDQCERKPWELLHVERCREKKARWVTIFG
jgi:hypothetical protein